MLALVRAHRPRARLVDRHDVPWMRLAGVAMTPLVARFNERFTTVIGDVVYLPGPPTAMRRDRLAITLAHELVHQIDQARWKLFFYLSYALLAPAGRTVRAHWERRAYAVDLLLAREVGGEPAVRELAERLAALFAAPSYGFMWVGRAAARRYLEPVVARVLDGDIDRVAPYDQILAAWRGEASPPELP
jgi:hypothetical protein